MKPIKFKQANKCLGKPNSMTDEECQSLHVYSNGNECVSCWKMSFLHRLIVLFTGKIYLGVIAGKSQPPVHLNAINPLTLTFLQRCKKWCNNAGYIIAEFFKSTSDFWKDFFCNFGMYSKQKDKRMHFVAGAIIALVASIFFTPTASMVAVFMSAIIKEYIDSHQVGNKWDWLDVIFTLLGGVPGCIIALLIHLIF